ncbi:MAG: radical SAM protein [Theionarchaea archaeon]|nr:radical SAM protein [Theionarchaea archaeon]
MMFSGPTYAYLQVNRTCSGCGLDCYASPDGTALTLREAKEIADMLWEAKVFIVLLDGGEPLLWDGIVELVQHFRAKPMATAIVSGGEDISQAKALQKADLSMIQFPIDGPEDYHDRIRGEGHFQKTITAIKTFCDLNIDTHVGTVISPENMRYLEEISDIVSSYPVLIHRVLRYIHASKFLTAQQCVEVLSTICTLREKKRAIAPTNCYTFASQTPYRQYMNVEKFQGCVGGKTSLVITCDGYVVPCPHFASKSIAHTIGAPSIWEEDIKTIWKEWDFLDEFRKGLTACQVCPDNERCGGCRAAAFHATGSFDYDPGCPLSDVMLQKIQGEEK